MDKTSKEVFREPVGDGSEKVIVGKVRYRKDARVRGYYFDAIVVREVPRDGYTSTEWTMGEQSGSHLAAQATRFNAAKFLAVVNYVLAADELIAQVKQEARASIRKAA